MQSINETLDMEMSPQPNERRRSSILKHMDRRPIQRDSRTVSFNITKIMADENMEITTMEMSRNDQTITSSLDMSMDLTLVPEDHISINKTRNTTANISLNSTSLNSTSLNSTSNNSTCINLVANINASISSEDTLDYGEQNSFGAFHDSNNMSIRTSGFETLMENMDALTDRYQKVEQELEECRHRLDSEIEELFKFYRHVVNENDRYEFAIAILGLRHSLWLWFKIDPETYPNEKLNVRLVSHKKDRNLYPLKDYVRTVLRFTKEGHHGYLTKFVINAQRFKRLLRKVGYGRTN